MTTKTIAAVLLFALMSITHLLARDGPITPPANTIRSATLYFYHSPDEILQSLQQDAPILKAAGFNTVWLVFPMVKLDPDPLNPDHHFDDTGMDVVKQDLDILRANRMMAMIGLDYVGGPGWSPKGMDSSTFLTDPAQFKAWLRFVSWFLTEIDDYRDMVFPMVFEEGAIPPSFNKYYNAEQGDRIARFFQTNLGNFPNLIDPAIARRWAFGWHDSVLITHRFTKGVPPIAPHTFSWFSAGQYFFDRSAAAGLTWVPHDQFSPTDNRIKSLLQAQRIAIRSVIPDLPLVLGETGYILCDSAELDRAGQVYALAVQFALDNDEGFNVWCIRDSFTPEQDCETWGSGGLGLLNPDGSMRPAFQALSTLLADYTLKPGERGPVIRVPNHHMRTIEPRGHQ